MALDKLILDGTETGGSAGNKINLSIDEINAIRAMLNALAPAPGKMVIDGDLPTVDMVYGDSHQAVMNVIHESTGELRAQFLYAAGNIVLRLKDETGTVTSQMNLLPDGSMENPTAPKEPDNLDTMLTAGMIAPALDSKASIDYVNNAMLSIFTGEIDPPATLGKTGDMYHQFATNTPTTMKSGTSIEDYSDTYTELYYDANSTDIVAIGIDTGGRRVYIDYRQNSSPHVSNLVLRLNSVDIPLVVKTQNNASIECSYSSSFDSNMQAIVIGQPFELKAMSLNGREKDYTKFNDKWYFTPIYNHTYDFKKIGGPGNEIRLSTTTWTDILDNQIEERDPGVYEYKHSIAFKYSTARTSAEFRFSLDGGATWEVRTKEVKDTTNEEDAEALFPLDYAGGTPRLRLQARCESSSNTLTIIWASQILERKR